MSIFSIKLKGDVEKLAAMVRAGKTGAENE
jgi:hypothetical protein